MLSVDDEAGAPNWRLVARPGPTPEDRAAEEARRAWFAVYASFHNVTAAADEGPYTCPCCGHLTLSERGGYEICDECGWEDDGQDNHDAGIRRGGPNGRISLDEARVHYRTTGGSAGHHRPPVSPYDRNQPS
jgi:hypothetical protein